MLSHLDVSGFSYAFLDAALKWMEQVGQVITFTTFSIFAHHGLQS